MNFRLPITKDVFQRHGFERIDRDCEIPRGILAVSLTYVGMNNKQLLKTVMAIDLHTEMPLLIHFGEAGHVLNFQVSLCKVIKSSQNINVDL